MFMSTSRCSFRWKDDFGRHNIVSIFGIWERWWDYQEICETTLVSRLKFTWILFGWFVKIVYFRKQKTVFWRNRRRRRNHAHSDFKSFSWVNLKKTWLIKYIYWFIFQDQTSPHRQKRSPRQQPIGNSEVQNNPNEEPSSTDPGIKSGGENITPTQSLIPSKNIFHC